MAIFSTFTSLLSWRISSVTSKSSNYTIVLINATEWETNKKTIVQYSRRRSYPTTPAVTRGGCMFMGCLFHLPWPVFSDGSQSAALYGSQLQTGNHGDHVNHVHAAPTAGWTVIVITIHVQLKPGPASSAYTAVTVADSA